MAAAHDGPTFTQRVVRRVARAVDLHVEPPRAPQRPRIVFVLGSQRSGTNALRRSLSLDPLVMGFNEREQDRWYEHWCLRPEPELREQLAELPSRTLLFKPIVNVRDEPVDQWLRQWHEYDARLAWIYRDPVDVFQSRAKRWSYLDDVDGFLEEWHRVNEPVLGLLDGDTPVSLVRYEDLGAEQSAFWPLCRALDVRGENLFRTGPSKGRERLDAEVVAAVESGTAELLARLDERRLTAGDR